MRPIRHIVPLASLIVLIATSGFSQTPTSGAMLAINGSVGSVAINQNIYDSQIHTGNVINVSGAGSCTAGDAAYKTDAYVLQGGSQTGCDPGDPFETGQGTGIATVSGTGYSFTVTTMYTFGPQCNTNMTICVGTSTPPPNGPDTGFLTITNNSGSNFFGTVTLSGTSIISGGGYCPANGSAADTITSTLGNGQSWTFALSNDSSNCGGWNADQSLALTAGQTTKFSFGKDAYEITPFNSASGDKLLVRPVPVPASLFILPATSPFFGQQCIPYADTTAPAGATNGPNPECVELQVTCPTCSDGGNFLYTAQADYIVDPVSLPNGIGGPAFLGQHAVDCPTLGFDLNIFLSYTADPTKGSGAGTGSCYVATYDPTAPVISNGTTVSSFVGFQTPVVDTALNIIKAGSTVPLIWQQFDNKGNANTKLSWCQTLNPDGKTCATVGVVAPWVFLGQIGINCQTDQQTNNDTSISPNGSGFQNFLNGTYQFNWKTVKGSTGCTTVVFQYDSGLVLFPANFQYH
jgi:hypothetical protein